MHNAVFDRLTRALVLGSTRRRLGRGLGAALLGLAGLHVTADVGAGKLERNSFGCVNVGKPCRGRDGVCCSGKCKGKRPQPGEKDRSRCVAHGADVCKPEQHSVPCGGTTGVSCTTTTGASGVCATTTGNAGYCAQGFTCQSCSRDRDCQPSPDPKAACIRCRTCPGGTACAVP